MEFAELVKTTIKKKASDIHILAGIAPVLRINGELVPLDSTKLTPQETSHLIYSIMNEEQRQKFEEKKELDFAYESPGLGRGRVNIYLQRGSISLAMRIIPAQILSFKALHLPLSITDLTRKERGLILVTGPTGSGKSTTLAAMIDLINKERACHIITIEDPIEYYHNHQRSIISQRELELDTFSFQEALKHVLRQDPDVILIGEMRDLETISAALTAAETGHLVLGTLHTTDAPQTIDRIIDAFPPYQQSQVRAQLSLSLQGVIAQTLLTRADGKGRVPAVEIMIATSGIRSLIREGKTAQIYSALEVGTKYGMQTLEQSLDELLHQKLITPKEAQRFKK